MGFEGLNLSNNIISQADFLIFTWDGWIIELELTGLALDLMRLKRVILQSFLQYIYIYIFINIVIVSVIDLKVWF